MRLQSLIVGSAIYCLAIAPVSSILSAVPVQQKKSASVSALSTNPNRRSKLRKHDRLRLIEAQTQGQKELTLLIASVEGENASVIRSVGELGGSVYYRDDDVSYLRVKLPVENVDKLARSLFVESLNINGLIDYLNSPQPDPSPATVIQNRSAPPDRSTPAENPYLATRDIGAPQFIVEHPTFDGRGVTIAVVDGSIDLLLPELQSAKTLDGRLTRKIADVITAARDAIVTNFEDSRIGGYAIVDMKQEVRALDHQVNYKGITYAVSEDQTFRIGTLDERMNNAKDDLNRDGNPENSSGLFAILWDEKTRRVWVDTNQNQSFVDEKPMTDYRVNHDVGMFGKDDPKTQIRETVGFTVQSDTAHRVVYIHPGYSAHGTGVGGVAAGKSFFGGQINGVAPEAQIISVTFGGPPLRITTSAIESIILAVKDPRVDVVSVQAGFVVPLNDGGSTLAIICDRLIDKYKKLIFSSAGNALGDGVNAINEGAAASRVIAVGSYIHRETARTNYGIVTAKDDNIDAFSARGPSKNGSFKPNILAPTVSLSTQPGFLPGVTHKGTYDLPPGYGVMGGTSTSTPTAAGAAALLISAAKQSGVKYDADRLRWAIMSSARYMDDYGAHEQGAGRFQVSAAWEALKKAPEPVTILSRAPVVAALTQHLDKPNSGVGFYEREGWQAGQTGRREIVFTRISGGPGPMNFQVRWQGNDGTFSSPSSINLPLNTPVTLPITITPQKAGAQSAILNLDVAGGPRSVYQVMNTIVAAEQFSAEKEFTVTGEAQAEWMSQASWYLNVPAGTKALHIDVKIANGNVIPYLMRPSGSLYWPLVQRPLPASAYQEGGTWSRTIPRPDRGVWQLSVANKKGEPEARLAERSRASFTIKATAFSATATQTASHDELISTETNSLQEVNFTNQLGAFVGGVADASLGSAFSETITADANSVPRTIEIDVPPGTRNLNAQIAPTIKSPADLDLYLFDCTKDPCKLKDFSTAEGMDEEVGVENPTAGRWKIVVDPFLVQDKTSYSYFDLFTHQAFGEIKPLAKRSLHDSGDKWTERVGITVDAAPVGSRYLAGSIAIVAEADTQISPSEATTRAQDPARVATVPLGMLRIGVRKNVKSGDSLGSRK